MEKISDFYMKYWLQTNWTNWVTLDENTVLRKQSLKVSVRIIIISRPHSSLIIHVCIQHTLSITCRKFQNPTCNSDFSPLVLNKSPCTKRFQEIEAWCLRQCSDQSKPLLVHTALWKSMFALSTHCPSLGENFRTLPKVDLVTSHHVSSQSHHAWIALWGNKTLETVCTLWCQHIHLSKPLLVEPPRHTSSLL